jgi:hypothetical protein
VAGGGEGDMRNVHVLLLSAFLLGAVALPVFDSTVGPGRFQAEPVEAVGQVAVAIWAVCTDPAGAVVCASLITMGLALWVALGNPLPSGQDLTDAVGNLFDMFTANGPGVQQYVQQYANHPNYAWLTIDMLTEVMDALVFLESWGFTYDSEWYTTGHSAWVRTWGAERVTMYTDYFTMPTGSNCAFVESDAHQMMGGDGASKQLSLSFEPENEAAQIIHIWGFGGSTPSAMPISDLWDSFELGCGAAGLYGRFVLTLPRTSESLTGMGGFPYALADPVYHATMWVDGEDPEITADMTDFAYGTTDILELEGERYNTPLSPDFLDTWDGVSDVPLLSGVNGAVIDATAVPVPDDTSWWEGLFGGLGGKLTGIGDVLQNIWDAINAIDDTVADVWSAVQALPDTMVTALSAAVVPGESVSERTGDLGDTMTARAPFAWPVVVFAVVSDLFEGGTDCPTVNMGTESVGWPAIDLEMCVPSGAQTILYVLTDVIAASMVMVWAYWVYRRLVGS